MKDTRTIMVTASTAQRLDDLRYEGRPRDPRSHNEVIVGLLDEMKLRIAERYIYQPSDFEEYNKELREKGFKERTPPEAV